MIGGRRTAANTLRRRFATNLRVVDERSFAGRFRIPTLKVLNSLSRVLISGRAACPMKIPAHSSMAAPVIRCGGFLARNG